MPVATGPGEKPVQWEGARLDSESILICQAPGGDFPGGPVVKICASSAGGVGSILGRGTMIPQVVQQEGK